MCLIVVALGATPRYPLIVAANRDEQHARPTASAAWWAELPEVFGGRDLVAGGTWLAVDRRGRFAAVTNVRDGAPAGLRSRGALAAEFLAGADSAQRYAERAGRAGAAFGAFNLLVYDGRELYFASNRIAGVAALRPGVHAFSNAPAGTEWPKIAGVAALRPGVHAFSNAPAGTEWPKTASAEAGAERLLDAPELVEPLFALLAQREAPGPAELRYRHAHFVAGPIYGTRCSTVVLVDAEGRLTFAERSFDAAGELAGEVRERFELAR